jgi:hypothetical protein
MGYRTTALCSTCTDNAGQHYSTRSNNTSSIGWTVGGKIYKTHGVGAPSVRCVLTGCIDSRGTYVSRTGMNSQLHTDDAAESFSKCSQIPENPY